MKNEVKHTAHSRYRCEYHLVFAPKYRRKVIYKAVRRDIIEIIKKLCKEMKVEIIEGEACPDHIHLLVSIPPYMSMSNHHLRNTELSLKAKGLLSLMLSLPEDWDYTTKGLAHICKDGVDSITIALKELERHGDGARYKELAEYNGLQPTDTIYAGQALKMPGKTAATPKPATLNVGDTVKVTPNAPVYGGTAKFQPWVYGSTFYVREISGNRVVIFTQKTGAVDKKYLTKV